MVVPPRSAVSAGAGAVATYSEAVDDNGSEAGAAVKPYPIDAVPASADERTRGTAEAPALALPALIVAEDLAADGSRSKVTL